MQRICGVSYHGPYRRKQVEIGKDANSFFSENQRLIVLEFDCRIHYSELPDSFFTTCKHLRTAYDEPSCKGKNRLHEWLMKNNAKQIKLDVVELHKRFKLTINV